MYCGRISSEITLNSTPSMVFEKDESLKKKIVKSHEDKKFSCDFRKDLFFYIVKLVFQNEIELE